MTTDPRLVVRRLTKRFGRATALDRIDLAAGNGLLCLLGPNGAGKTTLLRIIAGTLEATDGRATLDGADILTRPLYARDLVGYLPQEFGVYPDVSGTRMLQHLLRLKGIRSADGGRALVAGLLASVGLQRAAHGRVGTWSSGMVRRLGIAQAVAGDPTILILDEPTVGLDPEERHRLYRLLTELAERRIVLVSTHLIEDVELLQARFLAMRAGRIVADTTPHLAVAALDGRVFAGRVSDAELDELARDGARSVTRSVRVGGFNEVRIAIREGGAGPAGLTPARPTLTDAYVSLLHAPLAPEPGEPDSAAPSSDDRAAELARETPEAPSIRPDRAEPTRE